MKLSRNRTGYYIKEGVVSIFTHGLMSFASVCIIVAFLIIMGSFALIALNINAVVGELENENIILVYIDEHLTENEARAIGTRLLATPNVTSARFITREEALTAFIGRYENTERFKDVDATWLRHRYNVFVEDIELISQTRDDLADIYGVAKATANLRIAQGLVTLRNIVSGASVIIVAVLLVISLFIMSNTIKLAAFERREEIAIMKMVGATNSFIRWPFIYEGFILGVFGSSAAFAALWALYGLVADRAIDVESGLISLISFSTVSVPLFVVFTVIGFGVGVGGCGMALNRYLKV
ncbi:MAG: permease-like cell division protein FtsX [Oscillospiraceae bacterium]|nr:permease-like cell division protein FtsX [Oscillospiraceae bacterium]